MVPGDRLVCALVEPQRLGDQFAVWPLHITVVPWFRLELSSNALSEKLSKALWDIEPFSITIDGEAHFGHGGRKLVSLVALPTTFVQIEERVRSVIHSNNAWIVDETTKRRQEYRPHVTVQRSARLRAGESFTCQRLYIIEQLGDMKSVAGLVGLGS